MIRTAFLLFVVAVAVARDLRHMRAQRLNYLPSGSVVMQPQLEQEIMVESLPAMMSEIKALKRIT